MSNVVKKRIVVCGGNGFLGSRICKFAIARGWDVVSISRSGEPIWSAVTSSPYAPAWSKSVSWQKADILKPLTYRPFLKDADAVVHSMGILLEADYKGVIQGRESIVSGLSRAFSAKKEGGTHNPLEKDEGEELKSGEKDEQITYELMNRDSAITLAKEASLQNTPSFVYISAAAGAPMLPQRYISTKRQAEAAISSSFPKMRSLFIRPGFLFDSARKFTLPIAAAGRAGSMINSMLGGRLSPLFGAAVEKPQKVDDVAEAVVEAIDDEKIKGIITTEQIQELAQKAWRREML
ncbi:MAG: hypothetical protein M1834_004715 [Cirrosporium novae-zelandiae]|nr:MAG: hypothetical protein M1834_004715 [Cirrosporium novae-zelandiae]